MTQLKTAPQHPPMQQFPVRHNHLVIGGIELTRLVSRVGKTPFYAYDRQVIIDRVAELRQQMPSDLKIHYALKANPMPAVVQLMAGLVDGFDVASSAEMKIALDTAMPVQQISIAGPGKSSAELSQAIAAGITINVESFNELETIAQLSTQSGITASIAIRINPAFELKTSGMKMGGGAKPFGIDEEQLPAVLRHLQVLPVDFQGFHIYSGSQNLKADALIEAQRQSFALALRLLEFCPNGIKKLNIGGGYGIPYFVGESPLNSEQVGDALAIEMAKFKSVLPEAEVIIELGRYLVGEAGIYVCQVVDKKISRGQVYLVVNGGLHHHLAASGNFGQVIRKNYPLAIGNKMYAEQQEIVNVVGCLCTPLDILADKMPLPVAEVGDLVVVYQSGAYGLTASPSGFLSQSSAEEVLV
ncbi:MAG: pyridoxal-dependent decarboxylase, exosortase A system-associated [Methylococcaceae bacterium]|nr:pyridoxal-dependent decarboxylase, exosortase A system-associated [Methylococcaceae bacterium]